MGAGRRVTWVRGLGRLGVALLVCGGLLSLGSCVADAPPVVEIAIPGDGRATVSWEPPPGDAGDRAVAYEAQAFDGSVGLPVVRFSTTATTQTITGLTNGTTYTFRVRAID